MTQGQRGRKEGGVFIRQQAADSLDRAYQARTCANTQRPPVESKSSCSVLGIGGGGVGRESDPPELRHLRVHSSPDFAMHSIGVVPPLAAPRNRQLALLDERPRLFSADAGLRLSRAWRHGLEGTGTAWRGSGRQTRDRPGTQEGRRSVCAKPRGTRAGRFVLDVVHDRGDRQHRSHRVRWRDHASRTSWPVSLGRKPAPARCGARQAVCEG